MIFRDIIFISEFAKYNKEYGWEKGSEFLKQFSKILTKNFESSLVFRIFGDDYVILDKNEIQFDKAKQEIENITSACN